MPAGGGSAAEIAISPEYNNEKIEYTGGLPITGIAALTSVSGAYSSALFSTLDLTGCGEVNFNGPYTIAPAIGFKIKEVKLPKICTIADQAFMMCSNLKKVEFSAGTDSSLTIGVSAFYDCDRLESINLEATNLTEIGSSAFYNCTSLTQVKLPSTVTTIQSAAFQSCSGLTQVIIPQVTTIGDSAFEGCSYLSEVTLPPTVTSIGDSAFHGCTNLVKVYIQSTSLSVGSCTIGDFAFSGCGSGTSTLDVYFSDNPESSFFSNGSDSFPSYAIGRWGTATYSWNPSTVQWE